MLKAWLRSFASIYGPVGSFCALGALMGLLSHVLYFIHGFRVMQVKNIIIYHLLGLSFLVCISASSFGFLKGLRSSLAVSSAYFAALFFSIGTYRLCFHPLRHFPGPNAAKITKIYTPWLGRNGKLHLEYTKLHQQYGDFVRVGPNELSIVNPDAYMEIHGPQSRCSKKETGIFDSLRYKGEHRLVSIIDNNQHRKRRKIWNQSLCTKALENYEKATRIVSHDWLSHLESANGTPIDTTLYAKLIAFDNMGYVGYSADFGTVREGREDRMIHLLETTFRNIAMIGQMSWPQALIMELPKFGMQREFEDLGVRMVDARIDNDSDDKHDMLKYFLADLRSDRPTALMNMNAVYSDGQSILTGSTHTTSCVLSLVFYHLARDANLRQSVYKEIVPLYGRMVPGEFTAYDLNSAALLDAIMTEAIRMNSPSPLNGPRSVPPEGLEVDGTYLPGGINVFTPSHVYNMNEKYFKKPTEFIPERWLTQSDLVIDRRAFQPWGFGHYDCVGKGLAQNVIRLVLAYTLWSYDFEFAPGEDGLSFLDDARFQVILKPGTLKCVFTKRVQTFSSLEQ